MHRCNRIKIRPLHVLGCSKLCFCLQLLAAMYMNYTCAILYLAGNRFFFTGKIPSRGHLASTPHEIHQRLLKTSNSHRPEITTSKQAYQCGFHILRMP